jgi:hypothetical protein
VPPRLSLVPRAPAASKDPEGLQAIGAHMARVHASLCRFLRRKPGLAGSVGGRLFLDAQVVVPAEPKELDGFDFDYYGGRFLLGRGFLLGWAGLRRALGQERWEEVVRLFLLHEGHHIGQGMGYASQGIGRAGMALGAADYDADAISVELCLRWRGREDMAAMGAVLDNLLWGLSLFDEIAAGLPLRKLKERRLRRYLIWHFQRARAHAADPRLPAARLRLREPVQLEAPGLPISLKRRGAHSGLFVHLDRLDRARDLEVVLYACGRLYRRRDAAFCRQLLTALRGGRDGERVSRVFHQLFEEHPALVPG